jgi:hypothetical protein
VVYSHLRCSHIAAYTLHIMYLQPAHHQQHTPWLEREEPSLVRFVALFVWSICALVAVGSFGIGVLSLDAYLSSQPTILTPSPVRLAVAVSCFGLSLLGLIALYPYSADPAKFTPEYRALNSTVQGQPFHVKFRRHWHYRTFWGDGRVQFTDTQLVIGGYIEPIAPIRILSGIIVLALSLIPIVGHIVLALMHVIRDRLAPTMPRHIPYTNLRIVRVKGCRVTLTIQDGFPEMIILQAARCDGQRLYGELYHHFPAAVVGWAPEHE